MNFAETLDQYMLELGCTAKQLSELSGISMAQLSRYRNGVCAPPASGTTIAALARGLSALALEQGISVITENTVSEALCASYSEEDDFDYEALSRNLDSLIRTLGIQASRLASHCGLDPSMISRIRSGKQKPRNPIWIVQSVSQYVALHYAGLSDQRKIQELIGTGEPGFENARACSDAILMWLSGGKQGQDNTMFSLLDHLDAFDWNVFLKTRSIGKVRIPTVPLHLPATRSYTGVKGMEDGIIAFLKTTALSRPSRDVIIYSDHPMNHCMKPSDFPDKWMRGLAAILLKGLHIHMIHNIDRPFREMMLGLEAWVPAYMTGQITPYYFDHTRDNAYHHLIMVSGSAAIVGDAISGYPQSGQYVFYKANSEVARCRARADHLLSLARPLMEIYREDKAAAFWKLLDGQLYTFGNLNSHLSVPPIYTISKALLNRILNRNRISKAQSERIQEYAAAEKDRMNRFLQQGQIIETIAIWSEKEFERYPAALCLSGLFEAADIFYTHAEYKAHILETKRFAARQPHYDLKLERSAGFRNIQIVIQKDGLALVSKNKSPVIHFVIRHPKMVRAMSDIRLILPQEHGGGNGTKGGFK